MPMLILLDFQLFGNRFIRSYYMNDRKSFVLHVDSLSILDDLTDEQAGKLIKSMLAFYRNESLDDLDQLTKIALKPFLNQFARDNKKWNERAERARNNGSKGGRPKTQEDKKETQKTQWVNSEPRKPVNVNDNVNANVNVSVNGNVKNKDIGAKAKSFAPPTLSQIVEYCNERANNVDANRFIDHYTSNGWLVGKNKMKDWKAAVRTWERSDISNKTSFKQTKEDLRRNAVDQAAQDFINGDF